MVPMMEGGQNQVSFHTNYEWSDVLLSGLMCFCVHILLAQLSHSRLVCRCLRWIWYHCMTLFQLGLVNFIALGEQERAHLVVQPARFFYITGYGSTMYIIIRIALVFCFHMKKFSSYFHFQVILMLWHLICEN